MIVKSAARLCGSPKTTLTLVDEAKENIVLRAGWDEKDLDQRLGASLPLTDPGVAPAAVRERRLVHDVNIADSDLYRQGHKHRRTLVDDLGVHTLLSVPIFADGEAIGCIKLMRTEPGPFTDQQVALIEFFAAQAVIAIENARQFRELQTRLEREAATREILSVISQSPDDEQPVFDVILENAARLCGAPMARLLMANEERTEFSITAFWGMEHRVAQVGDTVSLDTIMLPAQSIRENVLIHTPDMREAAGYKEGLPAATRIIDGENIRTLLLVPLSRGSEALGCIALNRKEVAPFTEDEIALVQTFAAQAVIAIENVRQFRELQTRLEREAATREILYAISQSPDDEQPVFDVVLKNAAQLCGSLNAVLSLADDSREYVINRAAWGETYNEVDFGLKVPLAGQSVAALTVREKRVVQIEDLADTYLYRYGWEYRRHLVDKGGIRTVLAVPLVAGDVGIGCINLRRSEVSPFSPDQIALLETFAAQAVIAIENVRQFRELQTRLEREAATSGILEVISQSRDDDQPVFDVILENAARLCGAPHAALNLVDESRENSVVTAFYPINFKSFNVGDKFKLSDNPMAIARCIQGAHVIHVEDLADDDRYRQGDPFRVRMVDEEGARTLLCVPLVVGDVAIACINLRRNEVKPFTQDEIALVQSFAAQAVIAIENVRQFREIGERNTQIEALNTSLETRVGEQVGEIERMGRLKRFLSLQVADAVISSGDEGILSSHRALIGILFCDIRRFTSFCETAEPEETIEFLQTYHEEMGKLINAHGAGVDHRLGDGIMVIFNDPFLCDDPAGDALRLAIAMREKMVEICQRWKRLGHRLGFGVGVSLGYAKVGMVGSEGHFDYTANGTAVNMAARLCDHAEDGEILLGPRADTAVEDDFQAESTGEMTFKGIRQPVEVFRVIDAS